MIPRSKNGRLRAIRVLRLRSGYKGVVCYMTISKTGVSWESRTERVLPDPHRLLQGSGRTSPLPLGKVDDLGQPPRRSDSSCAHAGRSARVKPLAAVDGKRK